MHFARGEEISRPMTLLAIAPYGTQILHGDWNRPRILVLDGLDQFRHASNLRCDVPGGAGSDMALRASHARVRRSLIGNILRGHGVASGAAERHGVGVEIRLTAPINRWNGEDQGSDHHGQESLSLAGNVEVPGGIARERQRLVPPPPEPLHIHANQQKDDADDDEYRGNEEDCQVAIGLRERAASDRVIGRQYGEHE